MARRPHPKAIAALHIVISHIEELEEWFDKRARFLQSQALNLDRRMSNLETLLAHMDMRISILEAENDNE